MRVLAGKMLLRLCLASTWLMAALLGPAGAQNKLAFVAGIDTYANLPSDRQLQRAVNDAETVGNALQSLGFAVTRVTTMATLDNLLRRFGEFTRALKPGDTAVFFFAGHGVSLDDGNYLIPADIPALLPTDREIAKKRSIAERDIKQQIIRAGARVAVVVIDACRDNPFPREAARALGDSTRGLGRLEPAAGVYTLYSAREGQTALDRLSVNDNGRNSVFTRVFVGKLMKPGLSLSQLGDEVRDDVAALAERDGHDQVPAFYDELRGSRSVFLAGLPNPNPTPPRPAPESSEAQAWAAVKDTTSQSVLEDFIRRYGDSIYGTLARARLDELRKNQVPVAALPVQPAIPPEPVRPTPVVPPAKAQDTIKIGILHSLSGIMASSETPLKDVMLMLIDEQNRKGGVLGKKLEAVVVDPASSWPLFAEKARQLIARDKVAVVFGGWTSVSRKSILPVVKELDSILFYPVQYEGEESERNVFYTGAAPNQQAVPAVDYLMKEEKVKRWVLAGTDYVYPRTTNKILETYLKQKGVKDEDILINYTPFGYSDWRTVVSDIKKFGSAGKKTAVVSTINGDANVPFYTELGNQGIKATDIPVVALTVGEEELADFGTKPLVGQLAARNYFESIKSPLNAQFIKDWHAFTKNDKRITSDPMEAHFIGFSMWVKAVEKVKSTNPDKVIEALPGIQVPNLTGGTSIMLPNHHITKPVFIGEVRADGQFDVVYKAPDLVPGAAWSAYLEGSKDLVADWVTLKCGNYNKVTRKCGGS